MDPNGTVTKKNERKLVGLRVYILRRGKRGIFQAEFFFDGEHRRKSLKTLNEKVAIARAVKIDAQLADGTYGETVKQSTKSTKSMPNRTTIEEAQAAFHASLETDGLRRKTIVKYIGILKRFVAYAKESHVDTVAEIGMSLIDSYRAFRKSGTKERKGLSPKSMHHEAALLKLFLSWCKKRRFIDENPLAEERFTPPRPKAQGAPSLSEVNAILKEATEIRRPQYAALAFCGARSGELRNLRVEDVDFEGGWIHIRSREGAETKNGEDRKVPMHPRLRSILEPLRRRGDGWFFMAPPSNRYPTGEHHINVKRLNEDMLRILKRLKLPAGRDGGYTVHSLRRFFRTSAVNAGVPERIVDLWLGHNDHRSLGSIYYAKNDATSQEFITKVPFNEG
jgi:integrase